MKTLYKGIATTTGGREGYVRSDDGILDLDLSMPKSMGGKGERHTNPEQLFAAALQEVAAKHKVELGDFSVTANVELLKSEEGELDLSVVLDAYIPGVDLETGEKLVNEAHEICPYSRATRDNIDVTLNLLLDEED